MLNKVNIQSMRRKDNQKKTQAMATTIRHNMSVGGDGSSPPRTVYAGAGGGAVVPSRKRDSQQPFAKNIGVRHNSQQISPRGDLQKLKIMDLNDTFLVA